MFRRFRFLVGKTKRLLTKPLRVRVWSYIITSHRLSVRTHLKNLKHYFAHPQYRETLRIFSGKDRHNEGERAALIEPASNISIVIPIYNGTKMVLDLINRVSISEPLAEIIVVDDCSSEIEMFPSLLRLQNSLGNLKVHRTVENKGFTGAVNLGIQAANVQNHVLILNTDTQVPNRFASRMSQGLAKQKHVASITAVSNSAEILSIPGMIREYQFMTRDNALEIDEICSSMKQFANPASWPEIPTGIGFCMLLSRDALNKVGIFDEVNYSRGYGEENDWCMRARNIGFKHLAAPSVYVWHAHGTSFGQERIFLRRKHAATLRANYPHFDSLVRSFISKGALEAYGFDVLVQYLITSSKFPLKLIFDHKKGGGAGKFLRENLINDGNHVNVIITPINNIDIAGVLVYQDYEQEFSSKWEDLEFLINRHPETQVVFNTLSLYDNLPSKNLVKKLHDFLDVHNFLRTRFMVHDFHPLCPSINLIDYNGKFCDIPRPEVCRNCLKGNHLIVESGVNDIREWRTLWCELFNRIDEVEFPSLDTLQYYLRVFPELEQKSTITNHNVQKLKPLETISINRSEPIRILTIGAINYAKGSGFLESLMEKINRKDRKFELHHIGLLDVYLDGQTFFHHGPYKSLEDLQEKVLKISPNVALFPSICPETYSFAADELSGLNIPIFAFRIGAPYERFKHNKNFHFLDLASDPDYLLDEIRLVLGV